MRSFLSRLRASAGQLTLLAALTMVAAALLTGAPRIANQLTDEALRKRIDSLSYQIKDVTFRAQSQAPSSFLPHHAQDRLRQQHASFEPELADRIDTSWFAVTAPSGTTVAKGTGLPSPTNLGVRTGNGLIEATRLVDGRWPDNSHDLPRLEVAITELNAKILNFHVGTDYVIADPAALLTPVKVRVVGIVAPLDPAAAIWETEPLALQAYVPQADGEAYLGIMLTDVPGMDLVAQRGLALEYEWRYRIDVSTLDMVVLPGVVQAVLDARKQGINKSTAETGLDTALTRFADNAKSAQALFAVVQSGTLATLAGLVLLASHLAVSRRRLEFVLLRARGAALRSIGWRTVAETLPLIPFAAALGFFVGGLAPGRAAFTEPLVVAFTAVALLALPIMAMGSLRRMSFNEEREDLATARVGLKRRTAELSLLLVAGLGVFLLRRRGLPEGIDLYLVTVPTLLATATAIVTLRAIPSPLSWISRLASRARGTVGFLGLARAGRAAPATVGPVAVLVVAVCTTVFSLAIASTVDTGRERAADHDLPADALVQGFFFAPDTAGELRNVPGVTAVAPFAALPAMTVLSSREVGAERLGQVYVLIVDGPAFAEVAREAGREVDVNDLIIGAQRGDSPPALVSSDLAADLKGSDRAVVDLQGRDYDFRVGAVVQSYPSLARTATRFLILPWQGLPIRDDKVINPTGFLVAGDADRAALRAAGDAGQLRWISSISNPRPGYQPTTRVQTWDDRRQQLESTGVNAVLTFAFSVGAAGGVLMALLAVGFAVLAGARARGKVLSRLRTMGLTRAQGRRLLLIELAPLMTVAVLTGGLVGVALPRLIAPALNLTSFTDGHDAGLQLDPVVIGGSLALIMAGLGTALLVETLFNRRLRLGEVLRLGSAE
ncbi:MAG TPA: hypothetical protein DGG94_00250 [Micromonosporaceae bacterium]|nr:hypothetical protein [Micromonosporaceae bacterium]HCU48262.1 hypothetical protein [Micromonosporaceae bacterium]